MEQNFNGCAGIVTGASSGIGRSIAQKLGASGMELWLVGRSVKELDVTAASIKEAGGPTPHCVSLDLSEPGVLARLVDEVGNQHPYLFALINNAGVMYSEHIIDTEPKRMRDMFEINLLAPMEACRAAVIQMRKHGKPGQMINISSVASKSDLYGAYGVSKIAVNHMGKTLRKELEGDDIRVTTLIPGGFVTELGRGFTPEVQQQFAEAFGKLGYDPANAEHSKRILGDPIHIANMVQYILSHPPEINIEEVTVRPPISADIE